MSRIFIACLLLITVNLAAQTPATRANYQAAARFSPKKLENWLPCGIFPRMTTTADSRKRVILPAAKPGDRFDVQISPDGAFILRRLEPVKKAVRPAKFKLVKKDGFTVIDTDRAPSLETIKELLADFP